MMDPPELASLLESESKLGLVRIPSDEDKVYKEECIYSFTTLASNNGEDGLYICLNKFWAFSRSCMKDYYKNTGNSLYLRIRRTKAATEKDTSEPPAKVPRLVGEEEVLSGYEEVFDLVIMPEFHVIGLPNDKLPKKIQDSIEAIQAKASSPISDLIDQVLPLHLEMNGKQYTSEDNDYKSIETQPPVPDPILLTKWRGPKTNYNYNPYRGGGRDGGGGGNSGNSSGDRDRDGGNGSRKDGTHFRPWR